MIFLHYLQITDYHPGRNYYKIIPRNNEFCNILVIIFYLNEECFCNDYKLIVSKHRFGKDVFVIILAALVQRSDGFGALKSSSRTHKFMTFVQAHAWDARYPEAAVSRQLFLPGIQFRNPWLDSA